MEKFILIGEKPEKSSPLLTWANAIRRTGNDVDFIPDLGSISTRDYIQKIISSKAVIFQGYKDISYYEIRQLSLAPILNVPLIRKWSGSDVLYCQQDAKTLKMSKLLDKIVTKNISSETSTLIAELSNLNINCELINPILNNNLTIKNQSDRIELPKSVLVYLPDNRESFYGYEKIIPLIEKHQDLEFIIIANTKKLFSHYKNVSDIGWVTDMESIWNKTGCLLRMTEHDGISRMVCEALAQGKYIIFSQALEGCWQANNTIEADELLERFKKSKGPNIAALKSANKILKEDNDSELLKAILSARKRLTVSQRLTSLKILTSIYLKIKNVCNKLP